MHFAADEFEQDRPEWAELETSTKDLAVAAWTPAWHSPRGSDDDEITDRPRYW